MHIWSKYSKIYKNGFIILIFNEYKIQNLYLKKCPNRKYYIYNTISEIDLNNTLKCLFLYIFIVFKIIKLNFKILYHTY